MATRNLNKRGAPNGPSENYENLMPPSNMPNNHGPPTVFPDIPNYLDDPPLLLPSPVEDKPPDVQKKKVNGGKHKSKQQNVKNKKNCTPISYTPMPPVVIPNEFRLKSIISDLPNYLDEPPYIPPTPGEGKSPNVQKKHGNPGKHEPKQQNDRNKKNSINIKDKDKDKEKDNDNKPEDDNDFANRPPEESAQLNVPSEGIVEFFLANHTVDRKNLRKEFTTVLDYTRLVYEFMSNPTKNRFNNVLCFNEGAVKLKPLKPDDGEYIHATRFVTKEGGYIMTQAPLPNTLEDFWRLIWQENVSVIVSFADFSNSDECSEYFNLKTGKKKTIGKFGIKNTETESFSEFTGHFLKVTCKGEDEQRDITVIQWLNWPIDHLVDVKELINFMQIVWNLEKRGKDIKVSTKTMTLVHGISGTRRTGTFVVLNLLCKQLFFKKTCNMISTALLVRKYRHNVLRDKNMFAILLLGMIRFSINIRLLKKDKSYIDKVEKIIKNSLFSSSTPGKKSKEKQQK